MDVYVEVGILHIESRKPCSREEGWNNLDNSNYVKWEFSDESVQLLQIQNGANISPLLWYEEIGGIEAMTLISMRDWLYCPFVQEYTDLLLEEVQPRELSSLFCKHGVAGWESVERYKISSIQCGQC